MTQSADEFIEYQQVRAAFILQGTSFSRWCSENKVSRAWAISALAGHSKGIAAIVLKDKILKAVRVSNE